MKKPSKSLQEQILALLSRSRASRQDKLIERIETLVEEQDEKKRKVKPRYLIKRAISKMVEDEIITKHDTHHSSFLSLTPSGRQKLRNIKLSSGSHLVSTSWDGFWRMVIIDIPDTRKKDQDAIRYILKKAQFVQIKNSIWISPYPLEHMMINMKKDMGLEEEIMVLVTDKLDPSTEELLIKKLHKTYNSCKILLVACCPI